MRIEPFGPQDYATVSSWWEDRGWPVLPLRSLPRTGVVVWVDGRRTAAGWVYRTDSDIAWLEYLVSDPHTPFEKRDGAVDAAIRYLLAKSQDMGYRVIFTSSNNPRLIERLKRHEFIVGDEQTTQLVRKL